MVEKFISLWPLLMVIGFITTLRFRREATLSVSRVRYFVWYAVIFIVTSIFFLAYSIAFTTIENSVLSVFFTVLFLSACFAFGVAHGVLGHARSVNAYGNGSKAWMHLIPFIHIVLLFKRPLNYSKVTFGNFVLNIGAIIFGFLLYALSLFIFEKAILLMESYQHDIERMLKNKGLEATLSQTASEAVTNQHLNDTTTLLRIESNGTTLRYIYQVSTEIFAFPTSVPTDVLNEVCTDRKFTRPILDAGATIEFIYQRQDGLKIGAISVTQQLCKY